MQRHLWRCGGLPSLFWVKHILQLILFIDMNLKTLSDFYAYSKKWYYFRKPPARCCGSPRESPRDLWVGGTYLAHPGDPPSPEQDALPAPPLPPGEEKLFCGEGLVSKPLPQQPGRLEAGGRQADSSTAFCSLALPSRHVTQVCSKDSA